MGIDRKIAVLLIEEAVQRPFTGAVLELGKQDLTVSWPELFRCARALGFESATTVADKAALVTDVAFFKWLGFSEVHSLDSSDFEGADIIHDMNLPAVPEETKGRYEVVFDGGTMEHVFDCPQFLGNVFQFLTPDGRVIHISPTFNHVNHGFYFFSPTLFVDYYQANRFQLHRMLLIKHSLNGAYVCDCLDAATFARSSRLTAFNGTYYSWTIAQRTSDATSNAVPQQGAYVSLWRQDSALEGNRSRIYRILRNLYFRNAKWFRVLHFLRRRYINSLAYRWNAQRSIKWRRLM